MASSNLSSDNPAKPMAKQGRPAVFRAPRRISITLPEHPYRQLVERSNREGRSISNLAAFLLEQAIHELHGPGGPTHLRG